MPDWNSLTQEQKDHIIWQAEMWSCQCTGNHRQMALDMFNAVVQALEMRNRAANAATLAPSN